MEYLLHCLLNDFEDHQIKYGIMDARTILLNEQFSKLIDQIGFDNIIRNNNSGIISNLLHYHILISNDLIISTILNTVNLMKRDYLKLTKYYYNSNYMLAESIFDNNILSKYNYNTDFILATKDINFIIENKLFIFLKKLENKFVECDLDIKDDNINLGDLQLINIPYEEVQHILSKLNIQVKNKYGSLRTIIDGGSVIHNRNGKITKNSLYDLINIAKKCENPIIVIHERHKKTIDNLEETLNKHNILYFFTPRNQNDDIYILWFFLNNIGSFIVSNDKYKDHIFNLETKNKNTNSQFNHLLGQQTLNFNCINKWIQPKPLYSKCIQIIDNIIYIPHKLGNFIQIKL